MRSRRWSFAGCTFDEGTWLLTVDGHRARVEGKPLELLRILLAKPGQVLSKDELLEAIWPDVTVVEASLPTAVHKLRVAISDTNQNEPIIETVTGIGYRLNAPVQLEFCDEVDADAQSGAAPPMPAPKQRQGYTKRVQLGAALAIICLVILAVVAVMMPLSRTASTVVKPAYTRQETKDALRRLDVPAVERLIAAGWNPDETIAGEGNAPLHYLLEMCEWDPGHDKRKLMLMVRTLYENGARLEHRNQWGDTPYSIAVAQRYCGPEHPATKAIIAACSSAPGAIVDRCQASYVLDRRARALPASNKLPQR